MFRLNDNKQQDLFDPWGHLGPSRRKLLDESWPGFFRNDVLPILPVQKLASAFHQSMGRPSKEIYSVVGLLIYQQMFNKTDEEAVESFCFDLRVHYAFNIQGESDKTKYISLKTLWNFRQLLIEYGLEDLIFNEIAQKLSDIFEVDPSLQRIDSVHVKSNMKKLGRITLFSRTTTIFLTNLKRHQRVLFDKLDTDLRDRYLKKGASSAFALVKPNESSKTLDQVGLDLFTLVQHFKDLAAVSNMSSYKTMVRVLNEQCTVTPVAESPDQYKVELKPAKEISSGSLQNPSDPDAAYSGHKGQGYQAQIQETYTLEADPAKKDETLNLITHVHLEPANCSDNDAVVPALEATKEKGLLPEKLLADTAYGGDDNVTAAHQMGVELIAPVPGGNTASKLGDFHFHENKFIDTCPKGEHPRLTKKNKNSFSCGFDKSICEQCSSFKDCPAKRGKKFYYIRYKDKDLRLINRKNREQTYEFIDAYRWRAGVEATMSQFDRRTGAKHLRVRGFKAVRFSIILKAAGINLLRAVAARKARMRQAEGSVLPFFGSIMPIFRGKGLDPSSLLRIFCIFQKPVEFELNWVQRAA